MKTQVRLQLNALMKQSGPRNFVARPVLQQVDIIFLNKQRPVVILCNSDADLPRGQDAIIARGNTLFSRVATPNYVGCPAYTAIAGLLAWGNPVQIHRYYQRICGYSRLGPPALCCLQLLDQSAFRHKKTYFYLFVVRGEYKFNNIRILRFIQVAYYCSGGKIQEAVICSRHAVMQAPLQ